MTKSIYSPRTSDEAVLKATGKNWKQWFAVLNKSVISKKTHREIARWLYDNYLPNSWWAQMVTVEFEKAHGLRAMFGKPDGYEISVSKTVQSPAKKVFEYWTENKLRSKWLWDHKIIITASSPGKLVRAIWSDGKTRISANFYCCSKNKCRVVVQHKKLPDTKTSSRMKVLWKEMLENLEKLLRV